MKRLLWLAVLLCLVPVVVYGVGYSGRGSKAEVDGTTTAVTQISYPHHEIHAGSSFSVDFSNITANTDLHRTVIGINTPDTTRWAHIVVTVTSTSAAQFSIYENRTVGTPGSGTAATIYNRDRNSATTSTILDQAGTPAANKVSTYLEAEAVTFKACLVQ